jgi:ribosomal protein L40E
MSYVIGNSFYGSAHREPSVTILRIVSKASFSTVLILSSVLLLLTSPVGSQSLTTITSLTTATRQTTSTSYGTATVGTTTATSTGTATLANPTTFTVGAAQPRKCYFFYFTYDGSAGEKLQGKWTSNYVINFYVMSESNYKQFKYCGQPGLTYITSEMATSYSLNWVIPTDGTLYFVFENYATGSDVASARTVSFELYSIGPQSSTSVLYSTTSAELVLTTVVTSTSIMYSTIQTPLGGVTSPFLLAAIGVMVGVLIVVAIVIAAGRRKRTGSAKTKKAGEVEKEKHFCINCGAELSPGSKFCNKCGSAQ